MTTTDVLDTSHQDTADTGETQAQRLAAARERFAPLFASIAEGVRERDASRELPYQQIRDLVAAGFGALRVPVQYGGAGLDSHGFYELLVDLAAADSNIAQALRGHFAFVEDQLAARPGPVRDEWLARIADGQIAGNAWTEVGAVALGGVDTTVTPGADGEEWTVSGTKYYSTGSIFADWLDVFSRRADTGDNVIAYVATDQSGVTRSDDWTGFGQRTTGSGTTVLDSAVVRPEHVVPVPERFGFQTALYQQVLLATLAGIARSAADDVAQALLRRTRGYSHGAGVTNQDPQLLQVVGEVDAAAEAARAVVAQVSATLQAAADAAVTRWEPVSADALPDAAGSGERATSSATGETPERALRVGGPGAEAAAAANDVAERASARGQVVLSQLIPAAVTRLFDALGASATDAGADLDRHWRNARTVSSHNPWVYKARILGEQAVHGTAPDPLWGVGNVTVPDAQEGSQEQG